jgi:hypothetical protein
MLRSVTNEAGASMLCKELLLAMPAFHEPIGQAINELLIG